MDPTRGIKDLDSAPKIKKKDRNTPNLIETQMPKEHICFIKYSSLIIYWVTQKLPQIYTANHATFPIQIRKIKVQVCGNFWVTQYMQCIIWRIR